MAPKARVITPHEGIGEIRLGMLAVDCFQSLGQPVFERPSRNERLEKTVYFDEPSFALEIDRAGRIAGIEARTCVSIVLYRGLDVFRRPASEVLELVSLDGAPDLSHPEYPATIDFPELELSLWRPLVKVLENPRAPLLAPVEAVYVDNWGALRERARKRG